MGYHTDFSGGFTVSPPLAENHRMYLVAFSSTRRRVRDASQAALLPDPVREAAGLPIGEAAGFYVGGLGEYDDDCNTPPAGQPGLWCQWVPNDDGTEIVWDEGEKFYDYVDWIKYLVTHFLKPWGYSITGSVLWTGQESDDRGTIFAKDNAIEAVNDTCSNPGPSWSH